MVTGDRWLYRPSTLGNLILYSGTLTSLKMLFKFHIMWSFLFTKSDLYIKKICPLRKEIEPFLPPLKPEFCVKQSMRAILTDQPMICTPRIVYMVNFMKR